MKINFAPSKLVAAGMKMPSLSHNLKRDGDVWRRDSEVLRWIAQNEDLQMWVMCMLRASGIIVKEGDGRYVGNAEWDGKSKRKVKSKTALTRASNRGGRRSALSIEYMLRILANNSPIHTGDFARAVMAECGVKKSTFFRALRACRKDNSVTYTSDGWTCSPTSDTTCHSDGYTKSSPNQPETSST